MILMVVVVVIVVVIVILLLLLLLMMMMMMMMVVVVVVVMDGMKMIRRANTQPTRDHRSVFPFILLCSFLSIRRGSKSSNSLTGKTVNGKRKQPVWTPTTTIASTVLAALA